MLFTPPEPLSPGGFPAWIWMPLGSKGDDALPVTYFATDPDFQGSLPALFDTLQVAFADGEVKPFALVGFASGDWNRDFTPWAAPRLFRRDTDFAGGGPDTLSWLTGTLLPYVESRFQVSREAAGRQLMGYSLGGLFALWVCAEAGTFSGCASCSGSLWYDGMDAYLGAHPMPSGSRVYLSLGDKEAQTRNPRMARVKDVTMEAFARLQAQPGMVAAAFVTQPGGHFDQVEARLADALLWLHRWERSENT